MASVNKAIILGNLGRDPETRYMPDGKAVTNFSIATSSYWTDKASGEKKEATEWHRITCYGRQAEIAGEYLQKGSSVYVEGRLQTRKWQDKEGNDKYTTEIVCDTLQLLGKREGNGSGNRPPAEGARQRPAQQTAAGGEGRKPGKFDDMEDDIPF